ncbi:MAG: exodeoxyribonuclease VII large subunit [Oceanicaulis sp.]|uniref:exodeoxyribonuclease VII large subunit n=1 Tax=Glycocaulis sp. TaxID=1969725 RepID=UPI0025BBFC4B|nr:exodeoxyribonuclease VII large subunit [Glycocaulis sp.]MCC5982263.1 exodeoxyribonuclease VII large subunit [Oceanicaulis sp.]MCH8522135.1 exodeoxyribonuclease VII large subunit [Glycocaulis sp.]
MTDLTNTPEYTVSELARALKRTVEESYAFVRVRGELGRVTIPKSGHMYLDLKDAEAVIDGVMWKGVVSTLNFRPEEGLEVIAEGRLSTFPGRSKYQIIIERMEPAGAGALMALLEERKRKLAAEGLFAQERKRAIPYLPRVIGVVTSPTGAVIRDILHRLDDRFPVHVLVWPVLVQGEGAAAQIAAAIEGFNALPVGGDIPVPDVLIVARGGGSVEDLWAFNEEMVVRAAAASRIPLISAVGHETDTTLIDFASDRRAPTPTGAAEMAVPVRRELIERVEGARARLGGALLRMVERKEAGLKAASRGLPRPESLIGDAQQRLDYAQEGLKRALHLGIERRHTRLERLSVQLRPQGLRRELAERATRLDVAVQRLAGAGRRYLDAQERRLKALNSTLEALSHTNVMRRGFALVKASDGALVRSAGMLKPGQGVSLQFADGERSAAITDGAPPAAPRKAAKPSKARDGGKQGSLF